MAELSEREQLVLSLVVKEYISGARPVGSAYLVKKYDLGVSPATVRNVMAALEARGYLTHPHTSAGRVPTEKGYRYFVQRLLETIPLSPEERLTINHQFHQLHLDVEQWVKLAASVLSRATNYASLVTAPYSPRHRLKHIDLVPLGEGMALLVLVLTGGVVRQAGVSVPPHIGGVELTQTAEVLDEFLFGLSAEEVEAIAPRLEPFAARVALRAAEIMSALDQRIGEPIYREGLQAIAQEPEFAAAGRLQQVISILNDETFLRSLLEETRITNGVQVIIGGEGRWEGLEDCSLVLARYGQREKASGVLGVLGPMRMTYGRAISVVSYVARLMSDMVNRFYE